MAVTDYESVPAVDRASRSPGLVEMKFGGTTGGDPDRPKRVDYLFGVLSDGGSDATAVALAAALGADACEIFTDVRGVYTADPRVVPSARKLDEVSHEEMLEMAASGAGVMATRSVEVARSHNVSLHVRSSFEGADGTWIREEDAGMLEKALISAVVHRLE